MDIEIDTDLLKRFISEIKADVSKKAFGYFISDKPFGSAKEYIIFTKDLRDTFNFDEYGEYYKDNPNAGFFSDPMEEYRLDKYLRDKNLYLVGVFHSHLRHPAIFAQIDQKFHPSKLLWHLIISVRNPDYPQVSIYHYEDNQLYEKSIIFDCGE